MGKGPEKIADSLIIAIIIHIYIGWGFLTIIDTAIGHLTNNAYLGLFPALIIILPFFWMAVDLAKMYPNQKISAIFGAVFGKFGGKVIAFIYVCFLTFFLSLALHNTHLMIYTYFFNKTPFFLITSFFIGGALYNAWYGVKAVGRLAAFMLILPLVVIFGLAVLSLNNVNLLNVQPVLAGTFKQWLAATLDLPVVLLPGTAIFVYLPYIRTSKSIIKIGLVSLGIVLPIFVITIFGTIGAFSPMITHKISWAVVEYFHLLDYPYLLLEQSGLFFLIAWYPFHFVGTSQGIFVIGNELNVIFPRISRKWYMIAVSLLVMILVNLPLNIVFLAWFFIKFKRGFTYLYLSLLLGTWLVAKLRLLLTHYNKK